MAWYIWQQPTEVYNTLQVTTVLDFSVDIYLFTKKEKQIMISLERAMYFFEKKMTEKPFFHKEWAIEIKFF